MKNLIIALGLLGACMPAFSPLSPVLMDVPALLSALAAVIAALTKTSPVTTLSPELQDLLGKAAMVLGSGMVVVPALAPMLHLSAGTAGMIVQIGGALAASLGAYAHSAPAVLKEKV
jgi:hypothetical protein